MNTKKYLKLIPVAAMLLCGIFSVKAQSQQMLPGGVTEASGLSWIGWYSPESYLYSTGIWANRVNQTAADTTKLGPFLSSNYPVAGVITGTVKPTVVAGYNFNQALKFATTAAATAPNQMETAPVGMLNITNADAFTIFMVAKKETSPNGNRDYLLAYGLPSLTSGLWWESANPVLHMGWLTTDRTLGTAPSGIMTVDNLNDAAGGIRAYTNGTSLGQAANANYGVYSMMRIGSSHYDANGQQGLNGEVMELIIAKRAGQRGTAMPTVDIQKVESYLAIKYGITLNHDYFNSEGRTIWSISANTDYNNHIFALGIDPATGLNQVQSCSADTNLITIYKGTLNQYNNSSSIDLAPMIAPIVTGANSFYMMFGSNGGAGSAAYSQAAGTNFNSGASADKLNFRSAYVLKAQFYSSVAAVAAAPQTVNVKLNASNVRYVLVSTDPQFAPASTRIYPVTTDGVATGVSISNGNYITFAGFAAAPGGLASNYVLDLWVDGDHSTNTSWPNIVPANFTVGKTSTYTPIVRTSTFNYHNELYFGNYPSSKLRTMNSNGTAAPYPLVRTNSYYIFVVSDARASSSANATLLTFNNNAGASLRWNTSATNILSSFWNTTERTMTGNLPAASNPRYGITSINTTNESTTAGGFNLYFNGKRTSLTLGTTTAANGPQTTNPLMIGNANNSNAAGSTYPFNGAIQEIIVMKRNSTALMSDDDVAKIHSYLALKYSITLSDGNYLNTDGTLVWDRTANSGYNKYIFGLGRDDASGLYQKQSSPENNSAFAVFLGDAFPLPQLNSQNNGTLNDKQYLVLGTSDTNYNPIAVLTDNIVNDETEFENGVIHTTVNLDIQSAIYKAQLTGAASMTVKLRVPSNDFTHLLVSSSPDFVPAQTQAIALSEDKFVETQLGQGSSGRNYVYIKFIGHAPGPGGVSVGLRLWLRADDDAAVSLQYVPKGGDPRIASYTYAVADTNNIPMVTAWNDFARAKYFTYDAGAAGGSGTNHLAPVFEPNSLEMNYYPAVRFWSTAGTNGAYLTNPAGLFDVAQPLDHTAIFMVNNDFGPYDWMYNMMFGSATVSSYNGPGYGVQRLTSGANNGNLVGRFRTGTGGDGQISGTRNLFNQGSTSILDYYVPGDDGTPNARHIKFRFNGGVDSLTSQFPWNSFDMRAPATLGSGYTYNRTIIGVMSEAIFYDHLLSVDEMTKVESYLALKYGITLRPSNTATQRFTYRFSDNTVIWPGEDTSGKFATYYNNVSAVMRDDNAMLNNRHSHSTNEGSLLHLGVAGTELSADGSQVGTLNNMEAVVFGCTNTTGIVHVAEPEDTTNCQAGFTDRFDRIWLIHKITENDRPIRMLVGAQDNTKYTIGQDTAVANAYYTKLNAGYDVWMIVADSEDSLQHELYRQAIPMNMINGELQCNYEFSNTDTYITFGYRQNSKGCAGDEDAVFSGTKTFSWTDWTSRINTNPSSALGITVSLPNPPAGVLGDNIVVTNTSITYPNGPYPRGIGVRDYRGYPRTSRTPMAGSLEVRRRGGFVGAASEVTLTVDFNHPVQPSFQISGIDGSGNSWEQVEIYGTCAGAEYRPMLSAVSNNPSYNIVGSTATVKRNGSLSGTNNNGKVNVAFNGGITSLVIKYRITNRTSTSLRRIYISPITLKAVAPPAIVNEDGLSFVKDITNWPVGDRDYFYTGCENVAYSFEIGNTNYITKPVTFSDTLPEHMAWVRDGIGLDGVSAAINPNFDSNITIDSINGEGRVLTIKDLNVKCASVLYLNAITQFVGVEPSSAMVTYANRARIDYFQSINDEDVPRILYSADKYNPDADYVYFDAQYSDPPLPIDLTAANTPSAWKENTEVNVSFTFDNQNRDITESFMDFAFNEAFTYKTGSLVVEMLEGDAVIPVPVLVTTPLDAGALQIAGTSNGDDGAGFTLPTGRLRIRFTLVAPAEITEASGLYVYDDNNNQLFDADGQPLIQDLEVDYSSQSADPDDCLAKMVSLDGTLSIPYGTPATREHIITNKHVTMDIKK